MSITVQKSFLIILIIFTTFSCSRKKTLVNRPNQSLIEKVTRKEEKEVIKKPTLVESCLKTYEVIKSTQLKKSLKKNVCLKVSAPPSHCKSNEGRELFHYNKISKNPRARNILVFATFHGDEPEGSVVASHWIKRLENINSRNSWRILPLMNPDGVLKNTRTNSNGVDINRNFPTNDWNELAHAFWKKKVKSNPRRFPGPSGGSEPETQCAIHHIKEFGPDFIISLHTPYGILDFDGPRLKLPDFAHLRWYNLGTFPGSLGRFMWKDRKIPVLTVELKTNDKILTTPEKMNSLQDLTGKAAILVRKYLEKH